MATALAVIGLALTVSQLILMGGLVWSSLTNHGSFEPWLLVAVIYFIIVAIIAGALVWVLFKAIVYTKRAEKD